MGLGRCKEYDVFIREPGEEASINCRVCGTECDVMRDVLGPTSWAGAMAGRKTLHDRFFCPWSGESWHKQAISLIQEMEKTSSPRLRNLILADVIDALREGGMQRIPDRNPRDMT
jgi:hypothetical protein